MAGMFDLTTLVPSSSPAQPKVYSADEKASLLEDYELVPQHMWGKLPKGEHIRYENEGAFKRGAYISHHWKAADSDDRFIQLVVNRYKKADRATNPSWSIKLDSITAIWRKKTFGEQCQAAAPTPRPARPNEDMRILVNEVRILREKVLTLENNQKKLVALIKKHMTK